MSSAVEQLRALESTCTSCHAAIRASLDARPSTQTHLDAASLKLRDYMDALEAMKTPLRAPDLSPDNGEHWKQRRAQLKAEHEKLAAEFEIREKQGEGKEAVELSEEDRRLMSGRAPPPVVQNRLLELAAQPKTPQQEQRTFEPAPLKKPAHQKGKGSRVPAQPLNDTPEPDGRSQPEPPPRSQSNATSGNGQHNNNPSAHSNVSGTGDTNKVAPVDGGHGNGAHSKDPMNQPAASGCCIIL